MSTQRGQPRRCCQSWPGSPRPRSITGGIGCNALSVRKPTQAKMLPRRGGAHSSAARERFAQRPAHVTSMRRAVTAKPPVTDYAGLRTQVAQRGTPNPRTVSDGHRGSARSSERATPRTRAAWHGPRRFQHSGSARMRQAASPPSSRGITRSIKMMCGRKSRAFSIAWLLSRFPVFFRLECDAPLKNHIHCRWHGTMCSLPYITLSGEHVRIIQRKGVMTGR